jgi:hypothetical protein
MRFTTRAIAVTAAVLSATAISACNSDLTIPSDGEGNPTQGSAATALELSVVDGTASRVEINLFPDDLVAREIEVETEDDEEKIESRVTAIDPAAGTITLELDGLVVSYHGATRFRTETESQETRTVWEAAVQSELAGGGHPMIEARRNAPGTPQAPDDPSFVAADLRLENEADEPKIEILVDGDNLESGSAGSDAMLHVLGLSIAINGRTQLRDDNGNDDGNGDAGGLEFEMAVASVDAASGTLTLSDGTVVQVTAETLISAEGDLITLEATASAVAEGRPVRAEGRGTLETAGPPAVITASGLKIEVDD